MPNQEHERERERVLTHGYGYIPSGPRVNYSLLVMESVGMMKMATGEGPPSGRVPEQGPDWFLVTTEACGGGAPNLFCSPMVLGYMEIYRQKKSVRGATRVEGAPPASCLPHCFPYVHSKSSGLLPFQK